MIDPFIFTSPPQIHFGLGKYCSIPGIVKQYGDNLLLITGASSFLTSDNYHSLMNTFERKGFKIYEERVISEPSPNIVDLITAEHRQNNIQAVIAIGGGSVMDAGKAVSAMLPLNDSVMEYLEGVGSGKVHEGIKIPFIAVPTTAGTGTEASKNAVLSKVGEDGFKKSLRHNNFVPNVAVVDPSLTLSCPKELTTYSGMDAFTQLLESYLSTTASEMTDILALEGLRAIKTSLPKVLVEPTNPDARISMSYAALLSGITLANAGLGAVHGFASSLGGYYNIPHGVVCGTLLGICNRLTVNNLRAKQKDGVALGKYTTLGKLFVDKEYASDDAYIDAFLDLLDEWTDKYKIPRLHNYGVTKEDFDKVIKTTNSKNNPAKLYPEDMRVALQARL